MRTVILDSTAKSILVVMSGAAATTNPDFSSAYADKTATAFTEGANSGVLSGATPVELVAAPAASTQRIVKDITIQNKDTAAVTITVYIADGVGSRNIAVVTLAVGDTWTLEGTYDTSGNFKTRTVGGIAGSGTTDEITYWVDSSTLGALTTATYPSKTEFSYVKGVTSAIQTQLNAKAATLAGTINEIAYFDSSSTIASLAVATYPSLTELSYVKGVTSAIQTQIGTKAPSTSPTFATSITGSYLTASEILITDGSKNIVSAAVATYPSLTELTYLKGVTSAIQTQINAKQASDSDLTAIAGLASTGMISRIGTGLMATRTITGTADKITVTNGDGVSSDPTLTIAATYAGQTSITTLGTVATGTWNATTIGVTKGGTGTTSISALSIWLANSANTITQVTPGAGNSIRINAGGTAWEAYTPGGSTQGLHTIWIPAYAMVTRTTNGAESVTTESTTNKVTVQSFDFDAGTDEFTQFHITFPKSWNESTVTATFYWTAASGSGDVIWGLQGVALSNDDALDTAFGTAQTVTDTLIAANDVHVTSATSAITIAGTPAEGDDCIFQVYRDANAGGDTLAVDAKLIGVKLLFTTNADTDA